MKKTFKISGMTDDTCARRIERFVKKMEGVDTASVNMAADTLRVSYNSTLTDEHNIEDTVILAGYSIIHPEPGMLPSEQLPIRKHHLIFSICFLIPLLFLALVQMLMPYIAQTALPDFLIPAAYPLNLAFLQLALTLPIIFASSSLYRQGLKSLLHRHPNANSLVSVSTLAAMAYSFFSIAWITMGSDPYEHPFYFGTIGVLLTGGLLGSYLTISAQKYHADLIHSLISAAPKTACIRDIEGETELPLHKIRPNDVIVVRPGERLPADGRIIDGNTTIDESLLTGKTKPAVKLTGDKVFALTINRGSTITYAASHIGDDAALPRIIRLVEDFMMDCPPAVSMTDTMMRWYMPAVFLVSILAAGCWYFLGETPAFASTVFLAVLIIACPCTLSLTTSLASRAATEKSTLSGILIRSKDVLEALTHTDTILLDKTGVLTQGHPVITDIIPEGITNDTLIALAATAERDSEHPIAQTIVRRAELHRLRLQRLAAFNAIPGKGIEALLNNQALRVGKASWLQEQNVKISASLLTKADQLAAKGKTPIFVSTGKICKGIIAVTDPLKAESQAAVHLLQSMGIEILMLTGDNKKTAAAIARELGISQFRANMLPDDKAKEVQLLQTHGHTVTAIGTGTQDAPALVQADISIALGSGTDAAIEAACIVLIHDDLRDISRAILLSHRILHSIQGNLRLAFGCNLLGLPVAMGLCHIFGGPLLDPVILSVLTALNLLLVPLNALRIKTFHFAPYKPLPTK